MTHNIQRPARAVVVIGAGPVGLAAAAHLIEREITPIVIEAGSQAGAAISQWGHIRLFSPWRFNTDAAARRLLNADGWTEPNPDHLPTGAEFVAQYLELLANTSPLKPHIRYGTTVEAVTRSGVDKTRSIGRDDRPYLVRTRNQDGQHADVIADAVIDASGTWGKPNPLGANGLPAANEDTAAPFTAGPLPDVLGNDRDRFAGQRALVVGMGHSAANTLLDLATLAESAPGTEITWMIRGATPSRLYGGGDADALPARGALGTRLKQLVADGKITLITEFTIDSFTKHDGHLSVSGRSGQESRDLDVDVLVGATGFRPDLDMLREVRLDLDSSVEAPAALAPLIDPNYHSCGTVPPHGDKELAHPDEGFYIAGMKSYGRAPTFLMATGYEQVRSITAALAGDRDAADSVQLDLPETGVCSSSPTVEDDSGTVTFALNQSCCGDDNPVPTDSGRGLSTGVAHGYAGESTPDTSDDASGTGGCCGGPST